MTPNVGPMELLLVLIIALIVFGPKRLPELGRSLGQGINGFKDGLAGIQDGNEISDTRKDESETRAKEHGPT